MYIKNSKPSIGLITLAGNYNYGNRLQNYAISKIYKDLGFTPQTLKISVRPNIVRQTKKLIRKILHCEHINYEDLMSKKRIAAFNRFNNLIDIVKLDNIDKNLNDRYDYFSVGSDQVWNPTAIIYNLDWYFLEFVHKNQAISVSASIGVNDISNKFAKRLGKSLSNYRGVSVRETQAAKILKNKCNINAEVICDPTIMLSKKEWIEVSSSCETPKTPYIFVYVLGQFGDDFKNVLSKININNRFKVVYLSDKQKDYELEAGPSEFIDLISNAKHVITDSYHASVFSMIFKKPLTILRRIGEHNIFSRLDELTKKYNLVDKIYNNDIFDINKSSVYTNTEEIIKKEQDKFLSFLKSSLDF